MIQSKKVAATILARGQSKRLPGKNVKLFLGKPLIEWTVMAANKSKYIDTVIVSTDDKNIAEVARRSGAEVPFIRPAQLAEDTTTSEDTMLHALKWLKDAGQEFEYSFMLQPTSPLRTEIELDEALELLITNPESSALVSVYQFTKNPTWIKTLTSRNHLQPFFEVTKIDPAKLSSPWYMPNGAVYIIKNSEFMTSPAFYPEKTLAYVMPREKSVDIDDIEDFKLAEYYMSQQTNR